MPLFRLVAALTVFTATPALAQVPAWPAIDPHRYQADQHRLETERLRFQAEQRETFARQLEIEARLNRRRLEAARPPEPIQPPATRALGSPEEERALRLSASSRRAAAASDTGQIDAWLDRPRD